MCVYIYIYIYIYIALKRWRSCGDGAWPRSTGAAGRPRSWKTPLHVLYGDFTYNFTNRNFRKTLDFLQKYP